MLYEQSRDYSAIRLDRVKEEEEEDVAGARCRRRGVEGEVSKARCRRRGVKDEVSKARCRGRGVKGEVLRVRCRGRGCPEQGVSMVVLN